MIRERRGPGLQAVLLAAMQVKLGTMDLGGGQGLAAVFELAR